METNNVIEYFVLNYLFRSEASTIAKSIAYKIKLNLYTQLLYID